MLCSNSFFLAVKLFVLTGNWTFGRWCVTRDRLGCFRTLPQRFSCGEQKTAEVGLFVPLLLQLQQRQRQQRRQPKVFKQSQHGPVRRCFVISHRMRKRYDFQKRWRRHKQGLWIPRAGGDLLASNRGEALIVLRETKSSWFFSFTGEGGSIYCSPRPYKTRVCEGLESKKEREKKLFYYCVRSMDPLLMSPVFTFLCALMSDQMGFWERNRECLATFGSGLKQSQGNKMEFKWQELQRVSPHIYQLREKKKKKDFLLAVSRSPVNWHHWYVFLLP